MKPAGLITVVVFWLWLGLGTAAEFSGHDVVADYVFLAPFVGYLVGVLSVVIYRLVEA